MPGKHDRAGEESSSRLLLTGPIVVRGLSRAVKEALGSGPGARHRDGGRTSPEGEDELAAAGEAQRVEDAAGTEVDGRPGSASGPSATVDAAVTPSERQDRDGDGETGEHDVGRPEEPTGRDDGGADAESGGLDEDRPDLGPEDERAPDEPVRIEDLLPPAAVRAERPRPARRVRRPRSELVGLVVLVVLAVVCAGLILAVVRKTQDDAALAAREAASYTPPPLSAPSTGAARSGPVIAVISDESATRSATGVGVDDRWPRLLARALDGTVRTIASPGAGYVSEGANDRTFVDAAAQIPTDAGVVVFVGGAADASATSISAASAATRAFAAAIERAPDAKILAVGPLYAPQDADPDEITALRSALRSSARIADVPWVDPIGSSWVTGVDAPADLDAAVERTISGRLQTVVNAAPERG